ncbi:serine hydrolase [Algoriphagus lutimaris]|uniref:serine hydrolase domain-containing protein n=1 Tax=Algoriphagus lutimaris TaxID=613197 RepID=UPI00196B85E7|nr:serine hydrolase domain-containing protein [Algoriphagus lutimaris]MBN3518855.1 serine hydrolase [Algoriphagus lutimaris]
MKNKIRTILSAMALWFVLFLILDWWNSYPKVKVTPIVTVETIQDKFDSLLQNSLREYTLAGIGVGIVKDRKIIYQKAFGFQNLNTLDSFSVNSLVPTASISKIFTALAIANFLSSKGINADQKISSLSFPKSTESKLGQLTFWDFLVQQTGLKNPGIVKKLLSPDAGKPLIEYGNHLWMEDHKVPDNLTYEYHDGNFDMLGYFLQESAQQSFENYLSTNILIPSGMTRSFFTKEWPIDTIPVVGYQETFVWRRMEPRHITFERSPSPSSGLISSIEDLNLFLIHILRGEMGIFQKELNLLTHEKGEAPLGFQKIQLTNSEWFGHYGGQAGYSSLLIYSPSQNSGLILLVNTRDSKNFRKKIMDQLVQILSSIPPKT